MDKPTAGRIVHYVTLPSDTPAQPDMLAFHRPAVVVDVYLDGRVDLWVFVNGDIDGKGAPVWRRGVDADPSGLLRGTWHWPERIGAVMQIVEREYLGAAA